MNIVWSVNVSKSSFFLSFFHGSLFLSRCYSMDRWQGRTAVVTGAGSGIGAAIVEALASAGLRVVGLERSPELVNEMKSKPCQGCCMIPRQCDISKPEEIAAAFNWIEENYDGVQILVNNAGVLRQGQITAVGTDTLSEEQIVASIDTNIKGTVVCTRHAVASMKNNNFDGHIVNINSLAGHYVPFSASMNVYASTKHAITAFTGSLANELAHFNSKIKTTSISPGYTKTGMADPNAENIPFLQPSDIANAVLYALSTPPNVNNINPGLVETALASGLVSALQVPVLQPEDIAAGVLYALSTPPHVNITELTITAVAQKSTYYVDSQITTYPQIVASF